MNEKEVKYIHIQLLDGDNKGRIHAKYADSSDRLEVYSVPREYLHKDSEHFDNSTKYSKDLDTSGIYFLTGQRDSKPVIYIGQVAGRSSGKGLKMRVREHEADHLKDSWNHVVMIFREGDNEKALNTTELKFLESNFHKRAAETGRYLLLNKQSPSSDQIDSSKKAELTRFMDRAITLVSVLGCKAFDVSASLAEKQNEKSEETEPVVIRLMPSCSDIFYFANKKIAARMIIADGKYIVLKGSSVSDIMRKSCSGAGKKERRKKANFDEKNQLVKDMAFDSPTAAANFVGGSSLSGNVYWSTAEGLSPKQYLKTLKEKTNRKIDDTDIENNFWNRKTKGGKRILPHLDWMIKQGLLRKGDKICLKNHPDEVAEIVGGDKVLYKGEIMTANRYGCKVTGFKTIQIYVHATLVGSDKTLDEMRTEKMRELGRSDK